MAWVILAALATLALSASGADAKRPAKVYDGHRFAAKPAEFTGWQLDDSTGTLRAPVILGEHATSDDQGGTSIRWKFWREKKAVGVGTAWSVGCGSPCGGAYPWDGSKVRITAYGRRAGKFTRVRIFHWTEWGSPHRYDENYDLKLRYAGNGGRKDPWRVVQVRDGLEQPLTGTERTRTRGLDAAASARAKPTMLYHGNGYTVKPATIYGWSKGDKQAIGGRIAAPNPNIGAIEWQSWRRKKAVGKGAGWDSDCRKKGCASPFPWNGAKLRVTAYQPRRGHFTRMIVHARDPRPNWGNYVMRLRFLGKNARMQNWAVTSIDHRRG